MTSSNTNKDICPFGKKLQKYWNKRYQYFSKFDKGIQIDKTALFSVTPEEVAIKQAKSIKCDTIVDGFGCVGGNAIAFAKYCKKVYLIELDKNRLEMAKNNARIYEVQDKIEFIHGDFFKEAPKIKAEVIYLDPHWGGPDYKNLQHFKLENFSPNGTNVLELAFKYFSKVILRIPVNFDLTELEKFGHKYKIKDDLLGKKLISRTVYFM